MKVTSKKQLENFSSLWTLEILTEKVLLISLSTNIVGNLRRLSACSSNVLGYNFVYNILFIFSMEMCLLWIELLGISHCDSVISLKVALLFEYKNKEESVSQWPLEFLHLWSLGAFTFILDKNRARMHFCLRIVPRLRIIPHYISMPMALEDMLCDLWRVTTWCWDDARSVQCLPYISSEIYWDLERTESRSRHMLNRCAG